jgi:hypothetical protein
MTAEVQPRQPRPCRICQRPLALIEEPAGVCHRVACRQRAYQLEAGARQQTRDAAAARLLQLGSERGIVAEPESYPVTHLPAQGRSLGPLPEKRRRAFESHLDQLLAALEQEPAAPLPSGAPGPRPVPILLTPEQEGLSVQGCIGCRGACCLPGSTHAWLDLGSIREYRQANPRVTREEIRAAYLARLDSEPTFLESCVFHAAKGCVLPREMRSRRCNAHWCGELRELQRQIGAGAPARAFMVWPREDGESSGAFVDTGGARYVEESGEPK